MYWSMLLCSHASYRLGRFPLIRPKPYVKISIYMRKSLYGILVFFSQDFAVSRRSENCTGTGILTRNMYQNVSSIRSHVCSAKFWSVFKNHLNKIMLMHGRRGLGLSTTVPSVNAGCQPVSNGTDHLHATVRKAFLLQVLICFSWVSADEGCFRFCGSWFSECPSKAIHRLWTTESRKRRSCDRQR